ncbi:hypothetical protein DFH09DRAFT_1407201 [Mycena vulgaris]|nr:hypothetical protein DFH09DRAFT_1407201 [Mycena vulgaris]
MSRKQSLSAPYDVPYDLKHEHRPHYVCVDPCDGACGTRTSRNLIVSIDGTSNQFGDHSTNVVELYSRIRDDPSAEQLTYYNCGIGTYVPRRAKTFKYWRQRLDNVVDLAIAWRIGGFATSISPGDKIFLFGFSRGAYQVLTLAGMIEKVGLVNTGNQELIPFAFEIYTQRLKGKETDEAPIMAPRFKETFARTVKVHFVGAWDTVSSVGLVRQKPLPLTSSAEHICIFRHALALDERRVKFLPEYLDGGNSHSSSANGLARKASMMVGAEMTPEQISAHGTEQSWVSQESKTEPKSRRATDVQFSSAPPAAPRSRKVTNTKEVWFAGTHSDIGGGLKNNLDLNLSSVPVLWMENEAASAGLRLRPRKMGGPADNTPIVQGRYRCHPVCRTLSYKRIHASVAFKTPEYYPRANFRESGGIPWESFVGKDIDTGDFEWADEWRILIEMDLSEPEIKRLSFIALSGELATNYIPTLKRVRPEDTETEISLAVEFFQRLADKRPGTFDPDRAELLERQSRVLDGLSRTEDALKHCEEALTIRRRVVAELPLTAKKREKLASCLELLSTYRRKLNFASAALGCTKEAIANEYSSSDSHADLQRSLNIINFLPCLHSLSDDLRNLDRLPEALPVAEERVHISREIAQSEPEVFTSSLAESLCYLSYVLRDLGRYEGACTAVEEAVALQRVHAEQDSLILGDLAFSLHHMAFTLRDVGRPPDALVPAQDAANIRRSLAAANPAKFNALLAHSLDGLALALRAIGRQDAALASAQEAITIQRHLVQQNPVEYNPGLAGLLNAVTYHLPIVGRLEEALRACEEALRIQRELVEANAIDSSSVLANILDTQANILCSLGRCEDGLRAISEAEIINRTKSTEPRSALVHPRRMSLGTGQEPEALTAISNALQLYQEVAEQTPSVIGPVFSESVDAIIGCLHKLNPTDALDAMGQLVDLCRLLEKQTPGRFTRTSEKAAACNADGLRALGRDAEAEGA